MSPAERHNAIAPAVVKLLVANSDNEPQAFVLLESVVFGMMLHYRPNPAHAAEFLNTLTATVLDRIHRKNTGE